MASALRQALWECNTVDKAHAYLQDSSPLRLQNYISNTFASNTSQETIDSFDPKTGQVYARVPISSAENVDTAVLAAEHAFKSWSKTTRAERSRYLQRIAALIQENKELFAVWESIDQGKTLERARVEVDRAVANFSYPHPFPHDLDVRLIRPEDIFQHTSCTKNLQSG
jgi:acyl-CoA reductase-like NAD-dependent aldehyde dehydrogenase